MMAMHDLDFFTADESRGAADELKLVRIRAGVKKRRAKFRDDRGKPAARRPGNENLLAKPVQLGTEFDALVVGAAAGQERIQMQYAQRRGG
jgi:hypothetical protein